MHINSILMAATMLCSAVTSASPLNDLDDRGLSCIKGVRIISARGSNVPQNAWTAIDVMGTNIKTAIGDSVFHNLVYPATMTDYWWSVAAGVTNMTNRIQNHVDACPNQRLVLIGFSQGANVVGNTLIGASGTTGQGLAPKYRNNIIAAVQFGDPTFVLGMPFDRGNATLNGVIARDNSHQYITYGYAPNMRSYCDFNDEYCASGTSLAVHTSYFDVYQTQATDWIISRIRATV